MRICKKVTLDDVLECSLGLSKAEADTMRAVIGLKSAFTVSRLAAKIKRDRSVAQRRLAILEEKGVVARFQNNLDDGGYEFLYKAAKKPALKKRLREGAHAFTAQVSEVIDRL